MAARDRQILRRRQTRTPNTAFMLAEGLNGESGGFAPAEKTRISTWPSLDSGRGCHEITKFSERELRERHDACGREQAHANVS